MNISLEFSGGMELLFNNQPSLKLQLPSKLKTIGHLLPHIRDHLLSGNPDLFMAGESVRPGVLVLINDVDWELEGECEYAIQEGDNIVFISTLHGG